MTEYQNNPIPTHSDDRSDSLTCSFPILWLEATLSVCTSFCQWLSSGAAESSSSWSSEPFPSTLSTKHSNWVQTEKRFVEDLLFFPPTNIEYWQFNLLFSLVINVEICVVFYHQSRSVWVGLPSGRATTLASPVCPPIPTPMDWDRTSFSLLDIRSMIPRVGFTHQPPWAPSGTLNS